MQAMPPTRQRRDETLQGALQAAIALLRAEDLDAAAPALEAILVRWPEQPDALHFLGVLRHVQGRTDEGISLIRRAIAAMPTEPGPWNNLGNVLVESQRLDEAVEAYRTSVTMSKGTPASTDALNNIGTVLRRRSEWAAAEAAYREALALRPDFMEAWYNLSLALMNQGRIPEGLLANSKAVTLSPRHLQARDQVIRALLLQGERDQAAVLYREWLAEEPDNPVIQHQLAACLGEAAPERACIAYVEQVFDSFARSFDVKLDKSSWVALRIFPSSHTNPIFVLVGDQHIRPSRKSAEWCLDGVENCWQQKQRFIAPPEMSQALADYEHARQTYKRLIQESHPD